MKCSPNTLQFPTTSRTSLQLLTPCTSHANMQNHCNRTMQISTQADATSCTKHTLSCDHIKCEHTNHYLRYLAHFNPTRWTRLHSHEAHLHTKKTLKQSQASQIISPITTSPHWNLVISNSIKANKHRDPPTLD